MTESWLYACHLAAALYMCGLIWFVQLVHYPLLSRVGSQQYAAYQSEHMARTGWVVGPPMLVEALSGVALLFVRPSWLRAETAWIGVALLALIWLSTILQQVPCHRRLREGFDGDAHRRLVATNWARTVGWSARSVLLVGSLASS